MKNKTKLNILFISAILTYTIGSFILSIVHPKEINDYENRYANKYNKITLNSYLKNDTQTNIEETLSDQVFLSQKLKILNNLTHGTIINNFVQKSYKDLPNEYLSIKNGIYFYGTQNLVYKPYSLNSNKKTLDNKIANYNKLITKYKNVDFYSYYIEKDTDINFETKEKSQIYEYIKERINTKNISKFAINNFEEYQKYFYRYDHHWNYKGSDKAYEEILKLLEIDSQKKFGTKKCLHKKIGGSKVDAIGFRKILAEDFCAYFYDYDKIKINIAGKEKEYGINYDNINDKIDISYGEFYGYDYGEIIFDTNNNKADNILIIGNSYDNAILKLIAEKFNKTISIDLRNYEHDQGKQFDFDSYINKYKINKVLFIGDADFYTGSDFMIKLNSKEQK